MFVADMAELELDLGLRWGNGGVWVNWLID